MDWRCDSNGTAPDLQAWNPEFKLQSHQKTNEKKITGVMQVVECFPGMHKALSSIPSNAKNNLQAV
jgi:hypothetical protein